MDETIEIGKKTMKVITTRMSYEDIDSVKEFATILQYERKQQARVPFQEALHFAIEQLRASIEQYNSKPDETIAEKILQFESKPKAPVQQNSFNIDAYYEMSNKTEYKPTLQIASKEIAKNIVLGKLGL
jgi:hypothetical protein